MKRVVTLLVFIALSIGAFAQLPKKVQKMAGTWDYKLQSGFEIIEIEGDELSGIGYRVDLKTSDTSRVETIGMKMVGKTLVYSMTTYNVQDEIVVPNVQKFVSSGRKLKFQNTSAPTPYAIKYSFACFNKNKLFIRVYHGPDAKPIKLTLLRRKN